MAEISSILIREHDRAVFRKGQNRTSGINNRIKKYNSKHQKSEKIDESSKPIALTHNQSEI